MRGIISSVAAAGLLAACSDDAPPAKPAKVRADALKPGEYEVAATVDVLRSTDKTTPATKSKVGATQTARICVPADGALDPSDLRRSWRKMHRLRQLHEGRAHEPAV